MLPLTVTHTSLSLLSFSGSISLWLHDTLKGNGAWLGMDSGPCMLNCVSETGRKKNIWGKKARRFQKSKREDSKSPSICISLNMFVCVSGSAVVLQVQSRCLSFFCSSPASINRSLCVLQFLRDFVLFSLFFPSSSLSPAFLFYPLL